MPIEIGQDDGGKLLFVNVSGILSSNDYKYFVPAFDRLAQQNERLRVLFDMTDFHGWKVGALWEEIKWDVNHFPSIERLALVGDRKWEREMAMFCEPFTSAEIRFFDQADLSAARKWLMGSE